MEYLDRFLHVRLLQPPLPRYGDGTPAIGAPPGPMGSLETADAMWKRVDGVRGRRLQDLQLRVKSLDVGDCLRPGDNRPLIYSMWGQYDLAVVYHSPILAPPPMADHLDVRQTQYSLFLPAIARCNACYVAVDPEPRRGLPAPDADRHDPLPRRDRFLGLVQIKLAPFATWSASPHDPPRLDEIVALLSDVIMDWQQEVRDAGGEARAALGLVLSWHEMMVVAHAHDLDPLLRLVLRLRQTTLRVRHGEKEEVAHVALSTDSALGSDYAIEHRAKDLLREMKVDTPDPRIEVLHGWVNKLADAILGERDGNPVPSGLPQSRAQPLRIALRTHFCVNPGHEAQFLNYFSADGRAGGSNLPFHVGWYDTSSPPFDIVPETQAGPTCALPYPHLSAVGAAAMTSMLRSALLRRGQTHNFYCSVSSLTIEVHPDQCGDVPVNHVQTDPRVRFGVDRLKPEEAHGLRGTLRALQVSYEDSEQLMNTAAVLRWTWDSLWLWEGTIELDPVVKALTGYLKRLEAQFGVPEHRESIERRLEPLRSDIGHTLAALRVALSSPHWSMTPVGMTSDLNLRRLGSVDLIRSIASLIGWSMVDVLLGPRACLCTVGEVADNAGLKGGVVLFRVPASVVEQPLLVEGMAFQAAQSFLDALVEFDPAAVQNEGLKASLGSLAMTYGELRKRSLEGQSPPSLIMGGQLFLASLLLGVDGKTMARSLFLQNILAGDSVQVGANGRPTQSPRFVVAWISRVIFACFCDVVATRYRLGGHAGGVQGNERERFESFWATRDALRDRALDLRRFLRTECLIPPGGNEEVVKCLQKDRWEEMVEQHLRDAHWLGDPDAIHLAAAFFGECARFVEGRLRDARDLSFETPGSVWHQIRGEIERVRRFLLHTTSRATLTAGYLPEGQRNGPIDQNDPRFAMYDRQPLPLRRGGDLNERGGPDDAVLCQRGRLFFTTAESNDEWAKVVAGFHGSMIGLVPRLRRSIGARVAGGSAP